MKNGDVLRFLLFVGAVAVGALWTYPNVALKQDEIDLNIKSEFVDGEVAGVFNNQTIVVPNDKIKMNLGNKVMAQEDKQIDKRIDVDLSQQKLYAYENDKKIYEFLISSGTWNRTPTGQFKIWTKIKSQKMSGGSKELGTYFYLPNVPNIMFFYNDKTPKQSGYSIHGTYWHNQFGKPMSHGCINMTTEESKLMFDWAEMDTPIIIYGRMPIISLPWANR